MASETRQGIEAGRATGCSRRTAWPSVVGLALAATLVSAPALAESWSKLHGAVQRFRVMDLEGLDAELEKLARSHKSKDSQAVIGYLQARVLAAKGDGAGAKDALARADRVREVSQEAWAWAEIEVWMARGRDAEALAKLTEFRKRWPKFQWARADITWSRLYEKVGPPEVAAQVALDLYPKSHLHLPQDELLARAARLLADKQPERSRQLWKRLLMKHPESEFVDEAARSVDPASLSDSEQLERAERLFARRDYERCRAVSKALWDKGYKREAVGYFLGKIGSERLRDDYEGAATAFEAAIAEGAPYALQALSSYGIVLSKLGRHDEAIAAFDSWLQRFSGADIGRRIELHYDRARALYVAGRARQAAADFHAVMDASRGAGLKDWGKYWWFVAWWTYRAGDYEKAIEQMKVLTGSRNPLVGGKARYWTGKALDRLGRREQAVETLAELVRKYPLNYYSGLAEDHLVQWGRKDLVPRRPDLSKIKQRHPDPFKGLPNLPEVRRLRMAAHLADPEVAEVVFRDVRGSLSRKLGRKRFAALEAALDDDLEHFAMRRQAAYRRWSGVLRREPSRDTVEEWREIYPRAYWTHVVHAGKRFGAPEWMVYAHMLQESRYKPWLISHAPAYGLLELLDRTARRLAREGGDDYQLWMLMEPSYNVRWGTQYLGALYKKFHQQLPFAIASYNGGPMLLEHHMAASAKLGLAFDEMIDDLPTHECRNYVRMVIGHFLRYLAIYETPKRAAELRAQLLPKTWKAEWLQNPDY